MGMCLRDFGKISVEVRRESFIVHIDNDDPHPEYMIEDLDDMISALTYARGYLASKGRLTPPR